MADERPVESITSIVADLEISDEDDLVVSVRNLHTIERFIYNGATLSLDDLRLLCESLHGAPCLNRLTFNYRRIGDAGLEHVLDLVDTLPAIERLDLLGTGLTAAGIERLYNRVQARPQVRIVNYCTIFGNPLRHFALDCLLLERQAVCAYGVALEAIWTRWCQPHLFSRRTEYMTDEVKRSHYTQWSNYLKQNIAARTLSPDEFLQAYRVHIETLRARITLAQRIGYGVDDDDTSAVVKLYVPPRSEEV